MEREDIVTSDIFICQLIEDLLDVNCKQAICWHQNYWRQSSLFSLQIFSMSFIVMIVIVTGEGRTISHLDLNLEFLWDFR